MATRTAADRTWLIALAASMWGVSGLLRSPLSKEHASPTIVLAEHLILVLLVSPVLIGALRAWWRSTLRTRIAILVIGGGSSALATTLFTLAFRTGDPITPQVLQKLQPLLALTFAAVLLGERLRPRFAFFAVPALVGAWLLAFPNPLGVGVNALTPALLGLGSAALWALGTVLGRLVSGELAFHHVTALRFFFGMLALLVIAPATGSPLLMPMATWPRLLVLALVPGLIALVLYYVGLKHTPASRATLAELAFPLTAAAIGVFIQHATLQPTQWAGFVLVLVTIIALALHERTQERTAVRAPTAAGVPPAPLPEGTPR
ncbi:DMT family transporter [Granulicoccus sp. GXG6511]|uniref:DMT family transporter n=1 Tax=Granulicoccus sp. GXG6511 TaxID=3381351 RepID=UPI003D7CA8DF